MVCAESGAVLTLADQGCGLTPSPPGLVMVAGGKLPDWYAMWSQKSLSRQGEITGIPGVGLGRQQWWGGGLFFIDVCVWRGGRRGTEGLEQHVFCLASPETMSQPGRFVPKGGLKVKLSQEDRKHCKQRAHRRTRPTFCRFCVLLSCINQFLFIRELKNVDVCTLTDESPRDVVC